MMQIFVKLFDRIFRHWGYILVAVGDEHAFLLGNEGRDEQLSTLVYQCMKEDDGWFRSVILAGAERYFKEREVDTKIFIDKIK